MMALLSPETPKKPSFRSRASFQTRAAEDTTSRLDRQASIHTSLEDPQSAHSNPLLRRTPSQPSSGHFNGAQESEGTIGWTSLKQVFTRSRRIRLDDNGPQSAQGSSKSPRRVTEYKPPRSSRATPKLGTFAGAFVPVSLNVLSILMFLRFGFILGQSGYLAMMGELVRLT